MLFVNAGLILLKFTTKTINSFYVYHTNSSIKTKKRRDFTPPYQAIEMIEIYRRLYTSELTGFVIT